MGAKKKSPHVRSFSRRLAEIRKAAGLSQLALGREIGVGQRVIAYYEAEAESIPGHLLLPIARALDVSVDELLGADLPSSRKGPRNRKLLELFERIEELPRRKQKMVVDVISGLLREYEPNGG